MSDTWTFEDVRNIPCCQYKEPAAISGDTQLGLPGREHRKASYLTITSFSYGTMRSTHTRLSMSAGGTGRVRVQSPSPARCRASSFTRSGPGSPGGAIELGTEIHWHGTDEKETMQELNVRFAGYIEKVQVLEQRNASLRAHLATLRGQQKGGPTGIGQEYDSRFSEMRAQIEALTSEKGAADIERGYYAEEVEMWRLKLEEELALKEEAEKTLKEFRRDVDNATLEKANLESGVEDLVAEIEFLKKLHDEEVADLRKQIQDSKVSTELDSERPDLADYLRNVRAEIEQAAARNVQEAEKWYKGKFDTLKERAGKNDKKVQSMKEEIHTFHNQLMDLQNQIDAIRAHNAALEQQLEDMEDSHLDKASSLQNIIIELETQICKTKIEMSKHLQDYKELLNIKLKLDTEIATYRKLLESEEKRLGISSEKINE